MSHFRRRLSKHCSSGCFFIWLLFQVAPAPSEELALYIEVAQNNVGTFIRVGQDWTYRRYLSYLNSLNGLSTLFSSIPAMLLTGYAKEDLPEPGRQKKNEQRH